MPAPPSPSTSPPPSPPHKRHRNAPSHPTPDRPASPSSTIPGRPPSISEWTTVGHYPSPLQPDHFHKPARGAESATPFVAESETVLRDAVHRAEGHEVVSAPGIAATLMRTGPRKTVAFHPKTVRAAVVTSGGLNPGMNSMIRELFFTLRFSYGVDEIFGIRFGLDGFTRGLAPVRLEFSALEGVHYRGGSILGSSDVAYDASAVVDSITSHRFDLVFIVGGNTTMAASLRVYEEIRRRRLKIALVGVPSTVENDLPIIDHSFGFNTVTRIAIRAVASARVEAKSAINGVGLVKVPGKRCGHVAVNTALGSQEVDFVLIPEARVELDGSQGLLQAVKDRLKQKGYCVIVVSEGAAMDAMPAVAKGAEVAGKGKKGKRAFPDVGEFLKRRITEHFTAAGGQINVKYIDPCSMIRTHPPVAKDNLDISHLAQSAVHAAFAGYSGVGIGNVNLHNVMIPLLDMVSSPKVKVDTEGHVWEEVLDLTGQPDFINVSRSS